MKIYVVFDISVKGRDVLGVYESRKLAKRRMEETWPHWSNYEIIEYTVSKESDT